MPRLCKRSIVLSRLENRRRMMQKLQGNNFYLNNEQIQKSHANYKLDPEICPSK